MQHYYLGWSQAFLYSLADFFIDKQSHFDLEKCNLVLPSRNAGRNFLEILKQKSPGITTPKTHSLGELPDLFLPTEKSTANSHQSLNTWIEVVTKEDLTKLFPSRSNVKNSNSFIFSVAQTIMQLHAELSSAALSFEQVHKHLKEKQLGGEQRWEILENIKQKYLINLEAKNLKDNYQRRIDALKANEILEPNNLFLCSCYDLNPLAKKLISKFENSKIIHTLLFAPDTHSEGFSKIGSLQAEYWLNKKHPFPNSFLSISENTSNQSKQVFSASLEILRKAKSTEQLKIGIPGNDIIPSLMASFSGSEYKLRDVSGISSSITSPYTLLYRLHSFISTSRYKSFASLLRHSSVAITYGENFDTIIKKIDTYYLDRLPKLWLPKFCKEVLSFKELSSLSKQCFELKKSKNYLNSLEQFIEQFYPIEGRSTQDNAAIEAIINVAKIINESTELKSFEQFLSRLLLLSKSEKITEHRQDSSIDMMGWLELALDPSDYLLLTGMNDSNIPGLDMTNPFLNETLRRDLGLQGEKSKIARDCFIFETIINSKKLIHFFASKKSVSDDPQMLCRLLLKDEKKIVTQRTISYYGESSQQISKKEESNSKIFTFPKPKKGIPLKKIRVSAFKDYFNCPYLFYLKHVLKLQDIHDLEAELSPRVYGTLVHKILEQLPNNAILDEKQTQDCIEQSFTEINSKKFDKNTLPAVLIQLELLKQRLDFFIIWQYEQFKNGWCIWDKEYSFRDNPLVISLNKNISLDITGSIDRIDFNQKTNAWRIIDYKTSESPAKISSAYNKKANEWKDLQLPLYAEYVIENVAQIKTAYEKGDLEIAYVNISKDFKNSPLSSVQYTKEMRESALTLAKTTAEFIVEEDYQPANFENWGRPFKDLLPESEYVE